MSTLLPRGIPVTRFLLALALTVWLSACSGPEKAKPAALPANVPLLDVRNVWTASIGKVDFPLDIRVVESRAYLASSAGVVAAIDVQNGVDVWRTQLNTTLSAGVGSDGHYAAVVTRTNELVVLEGGKVVWRQGLKA